MSYEDYVNRKKELTEFIRAHEVKVWRIEAQLEDVISPSKLEQLLKVRRRIQFLRDLSDFIDYWIININTDFQQFKRWLDRLPDIATMITYIRFQNFHDFKVEIIKVITTMDEQWLEIYPFHRNVIAEKFAEKAIIEKEAMVLRSLRRAL